MTPNSRLFLGLLSILLTACGGQTSNSGLPDPNPLPPTERVLYTAGDQEQGVQLWTSDGTPQGTRILKIINKQGLVSPLDYQSWAFTNVQATPFTLWRGNYWFFANDSVHGAELWTSDGTPGGTQMVKDLSPGPGNAVALNISDLRIHPTQDRLFFIASPTSEPWPGWGRYLWQSDGSDAGTRPITDPVENLSGPRCPTIFGPRVLFLSDPPPTDWRGNFVTTNGTSQGTTRLSQNLMGLNPFVVGQFFLTSGYCRDMAGSDGLYVVGLNGQATQSIASFDSNTYVFDAHWNRETGPRDLNGLALFERADFIDGTIRLSLWRTDATGTGTFKLMELAQVTKQIANCSIYFQGKWFFAADDGIHGLELWCSDGTIQGTRLFKDLIPGPNGSSPGISLEGYLCTGGFFEFKGKLFFGANANGNYQLWVSDGTPNGTHTLMDASQPKESSPVWPAAYCALGDTLYFSATTTNVSSNRQLWRTDGTPAGTRQVSSHDFGTSLNPIWTIVPSPKP